ncbi:hypothetical protein REPUB_Repub11eG0021400 [Reevesia pubescens]
MQNIISSSTTSILIPLIIFLFSFDPHDTIIKAMNLLSSLLLLIIIFLLSPLFLHSALSMRKLQDFGVNKARESSMDLDYQHTVRKILIFFLVLFH